MKRFRCDHCRNIFTSEDYFELVDIIVCECPRCKKPAKQIFDRRRLDF